MELIREAFSDKKEAFKVGAAFSLIPFLLGLILNGSSLALIVPIALQVLQNAFWAEYLKSGEIKLQFNLGAGLGVLVGGTLAVLIVFIPVGIIVTLLAVLSNITLAVIVFTVLFLLVFTAYVPIRTLAFKHATTFNDGFNLALRLLKPATYLRYLGKWFLVELKYALLLVPYGFVAFLLSITLVAMPFAFVLLALLYRNFTRELET